MPGFRAAADKKQSDSIWGFLPISIFPNTEPTGGEGIGSSKSSCAASVPEIFDALETGGEGICFSKSSCAASVPEVFDALENCELL
jgi:hypothetical protein